MQLQNLLQKPAPALEKAQHVSLVQQAAPQP
jgi:hypothetical protein